MNASLWTYILLATAIALAIPLSLLVVNRPAFLQTPDQVVVREPGERFLGQPRPVAEEAEKEFVFALLSQAVYQREPGAEAVKDDECVDADAILSALGWTQWKEFPEQGLQGRFASVHLRVEVWSNPSNNAVVVAFAGTVFTNLKDWRANLRWFFPRKKDEYTMVVTTFGEAFVKEFLKREQKPDGYFLRHAHLFSTGHSLGGGLSQEFAYSLPINEGVPRVEHVYAFDPSPVTGFFSVERDLRDQNSKDLKIDRIYERGEIVAYLRIFTNFFDPPSADHPIIRQVRYNLFSAWTAVAKHSIARLACRLYRVSKKREPMPASAA
jgi:hypothetical protein